MLEELHHAGFEVAPGDLGENVTTRGIDLLTLPTGTRLRLGARAAIEITGLRNPCAQIERFRTGLLAAVLDRDEHGRLIRKTGIMAVVRAAGEVRAGDSIAVTLPPAPHRQLVVV